MTHDWAPHSADSELASLSGAIGVRTEPTGRAGDARVGIDGLSQAGEIGGLCIGDGVESRLVRRLKESRLVCDSHQYSIYSIHHLVVCLQGAVLMSERKNGLRQFNMLHWTKSFTFIHGFCKLSPAGYLKTC